MATVPLLQKAGVAIRTTQTFKLTGKEGLRLAPPVEETEDPEELREVGFAPATEGTRIG